MGEKRRFTGTMRDINSSFLPPDFADNSSLHVVFILLEYFSLMSFTSAVDTLVTSNLVSISRRFSFSIIGIDKSAVISDLGIKISADKTLDELLHNQPMDLLIVCGGLRSQTGEQIKLSRKLRQIASRKVRLGGIWNGVLALAHAGLLGDEQYALHPENHAYAREHFPASRLSDATHIIGNKLVSAAGPVSTLEMMIKLIEQLQGIKIANAVRKILTCDLINQTTEFPGLRATHSSSIPQVLKDTIQLMSSNMEEPLSIDELSNWTGSSRRRLERLFRVHLQTSPSRYYLELRMTHARQLLLQSSDSITSIATTAGFVTATYFSRCFKEFFSISPIELRNQKRRERLAQEKEDGKNL